MGYREKDLFRLNRVRNYLKVLYVSDIIEGNGKKMRRSIYNGKNDHSIISQYMWRKKHLSKKDVKIWKIAMTKLVPDRFLPYTLRNWKQKSHNIQRWSYNEGNGILIFNKQDKFYMFERTNLIMTRKRR